MSETETSTEAGGATTTPAAETPATEAAPAPVAPQEPKPFYLGVGRRKAAVSRVRIKPNGTGDFKVNKRPLDEYFLREQDRIHLLSPLHLTGTRTQYDVAVTVRGGGMNGQAGATRLGIARALVDASRELYPTLKEAGFLTRDARKVERKKPGKRGARASFQFSKR